MRFYKCVIIPLLSQLSASFDGQSDPATEEFAARIWEDPDCLTGRALDWASIRQALQRAPANDHRLAAFIEQLSTTIGWDDIIEDCLFGGVTLVYWHTRQLLELGHLEAASLHFSLLDSYASSFHPAIMARGSWGVSDWNLTVLRRDLAARNAPSDALPDCGKVYVYTEDEAPSLRYLTQGAAFCGKGQWGSEVHIHYWLLSSPYRTFDPAQADYFFVPGYGICVFEGGFLNLTEINDIYTALIGELPHWQEGGRRHVFTFASGMAVGVFNDWERYIPNATVLTPETGIFNDNRWQKKPFFEPWRDVAIPGHLHRSEIMHFLQVARPLEDRRYLAVFFGRVDPSRASHVASTAFDDAPRQALFEMIRQYGPMEDVLFGSNLTAEQMRSTMGDSVFCLVPRVPLERVRGLMAGGRQARCLFSYGLGSIWGPMSFLQERHVPLDHDLCPEAEAFTGICTALRLMFSAQQ
ncbi:hypothetical protein FOZ61_008226 [Perkinsus olseni]|uniref:Exostosin GT47 domain-containing protein n=1 Tax=Perkinsus olseni TaxID=32597 RepID=A0A7J6M7L6_PEROL|nr:hypothetical protein FOZ61_008226 [Perkinsus olseni]KAF4674406.1 hypothetical protein FOL46_004967 [Perkinsus olseni]